MVPVCAILAWGRVASVKKVKYQSASNIRASGRRAFLSKIRGSRAILLPGPHGNHMALGIRLTGKSFISFASQVSTEA